ncbi:MAG: RluA family pseudouridine synthase [Treponema sp.]|jgi:23S rRNA pseudouridine955/2504/2580 synthase|nr:RluA family pseudouridine synthase [Treponema sp.]
MRNIPVLFENDDCMVLDKPAGLAVQGGKGVSVSLDAILEESYKTRPLLVHRLDKDTSGLILVAKNKEAAAFFSSLFDRGQKRQGGIAPIAKQYLAAVRGIPEPKDGVIRLDLNINSREKKSETSYRLLASLNQDYSLLELELGTGRMHQIRRHLAMIKHPVLGDDKYGDFALNKLLRRTMGLKRLLLHACRLKIAPCRLLPQGLDLYAAAPDYFTGFFPVPNPPV